MSSTWFARGVPSALADTLPDNGQRWLAFAATQYHKNRKYGLIYFASYSNHIGERIMAEKKARGKGKATEWDKATWVGFRNIDLTADDKIEFAAWEVEGEGILGMLSDAVGTGHKLSMQMANEGKSVSATLTGAFVGCPNAGYSMSAYGKDPWVALRVLMFKHHVLCDGLWDSHTTADMGDIG